MPLNIHLEDEDGITEASLNERWLLLGLISRSEDAGRERGCYVDFIDPYGLTIFNRLQLPGLKKEVAELQKYATDASEIDFLNKLLQLISQCEQKVHHYIRFVGD